MFKCDSAERRLFSKKKMSDVGPVIQHGGCWSNFYQVERQQPTMALASTPIENLKEREKLYYLQDS